VTTDLNDIWAQVLDELRRAVSATTFEIWLAPLRPRAIEDCTLIVEAPVEIRAFLADRFGRLLGSCVQSVIGAGAEVDLVSTGTPESRPRRVGAVQTGFGAPAAELSFNPKLSFDQFVIGDSNRLAHAAALAVAEMPAQAYNPLFIYGPPGLGKTHLLHSIANYVSTYGGGLTVRYTTVESFTNEFLAALQGGSVEGFKSRFRRNDVLLIDDVQFLERKVRTEEEFFHTFNALYDVGGQIVVTSDRLPADLGALEDRLRERFEAGLVTDIRPPDIDMRMTILRKRVQHDGLHDIDPAALQLIAERIRLNIRALEGALIRVVAFASLTGRQITAELAAEVLDGLYPRETTRERTIAEIQQATCEQFGITREELLGSSRAARVTWPRQVAMYLARELTQQSLPAIGRAFGGRDHTTVLHAHRRANQLMASDRGAFDAVHSLTDRLLSEPS
jgi:chromosomal replication initiator protein